MLSDLLFALRRMKWNQLQYFRNTYSPMSPWRRQIATLVAATRTEAARYGVRSGIDRRRVYQVARMVVSNRRGEHLADLLPDAYLAYSPPSSATHHSGKRKYAAPAERREAFRAHAQTLAYLLTPAKLARVGVGASPDGGLVVIEAGESAISQEQVVQRLQSLVAGKASDADLRAYAEVLVRLHAGVPEIVETDDKAA